MMLIRVLLLLVVANLSEAEDWPRFRGPNGAGVVDGTVVGEPSLKDNLMWKTAVPRGHSSPVIVGDRIYLTAVEDEKLFTLALDRKTGARPLETASSSPAARSIQRAEQPRLAHAG